jgi:hypothetical protein
MYIFENKQISLAHVAMVEWIEDKVDAVDPLDGKPKSWHAFKIHMSNGHVQQMLFEKEEICREKWEALIDLMERAGY